MTLKLLILRLEGPLQSWGEYGKWDERDTALFPTKSGVIGLIACCFGYSRGDPRVLELTNGLLMAARADRAGRVMTDFQTVQGMPIILNAKGKPRGGSNTFITQRMYLQDAAFTIYLSGKDELLGECKNALKSPKWFTYLGRKSCVPTVPVFLELTTRYETLEQAINEYPLAQRADRKQLYEVECNDGSTVRMDRLIDPGRRVFDKRYVNVGIADEGVDRQ